jgi:hypothetical protein
MQVKLRLTAITLFDIGASEEAIQSFMAQIAGDEKIAGFKAVYRNTILSDGSRRSFAKISKLMEREELEIDWIVAVTKKFFDAGHHDVAWRVTKIDPSDVNGENTTDSFPVELFRNSLEEDV